MPYTTENPAAVKNYRHVGSAVGKFCISSREGVPNCKLFQKNISGYFSHPLSGGGVLKHRKSVLILIAPYTTISMSSMSLILKAITKDAISNTFAMFLNEVTIIFVIM